MANSIYIGVNVSIPESLTRSTPSNLRCYNNAYALTATHVGDYALFAGGHDQNNGCYVTAYDKSLTMSSPGTIGSQGYGTLSDPGSAYVGNYALFAGGYDGQYNANSVVSAFDTSLTKSLPDGLTTVLANTSGVNIGNYALFIGGSKSGSNQTYRRSHAYDTSLTRILPEDDIIGAKYSASHIGNYALFACSSANNTEVIVYDTSLTKTILYDLSIARKDSSAAHTENHVLFFGGRSSSSSSSGTPYSRVDAYDSSLTRTLPSELSNTVYQSAATNVNGKALVGGGSINSSANVSSSVEMYDSSLTKTKVDPGLVSARDDLAATHIGNFALFGGGYNQYDKAGKVTAYEYIVASSINVAKKII